VDADLDYALTLVAAVLLGTGFVLQQRAAELEPESRFLSPRLIASLLRNPSWLAGIACMVFGELLAAWSIGQLELSIVEPLLATNLIFALVLAVPMSGQAVRATEVAGAIVLCAGVTILSLARSARPIGMSFGSFSHWPAAGAIAFIAFIAIHFGRRRSGSLRATLTGLGAGLVFGIQDALTRQTLQIEQAQHFGALFTSWSAYSLVAAGIVGIWLMESAFSAGPLHASLPTIAAGEPVAGILLGILVFGDRVQLSPGMLALQAGGIAALVIGVVAVARAPALNSLGKAAISKAIPSHPDPDPDQEPAPEEHPDPKPAASQHLSDLKAKPPSRTDRGSPTTRPAPRLARHPGSPGTPAQPGRPGIVHATVTPQQHPRFIAIYQGVK
jgi:hypothetical protein